MVIQTADGIEIYLDSHRRRRFFFADAVERRQRNVADLILVVGGMCR